MKDSEKKVPSIMPIISASRKIFNPLPESPQSQRIPFINLKCLAKGKTSVYVVNSPSHNVPVVLKLFPFSNDQPNINYKNEVRFNALSHSNVIRQLSYSDEYQSCETSASSSYIMMEYAPYGDFHSIAREYRMILEERLVRTYFHQMIEGLEYLHSQGVYHLDIKLSNLLLGARYQLKIADFDIAYKKIDNKAIRSKGTKNFRAPELVRRECKNPAAADIYSVGIVLFTLFTAGYHPHTEEECYQGLNFFELLGNDT
jgi:serine/threonine protein kinase